MGEGQSKQNAKLVYNKKIDKFELDVCIQDIKYTSEIQQNRRKGESNAKEKDLKVMIAKERKDRDRVAEFEKARSLTNDAKIIRAYGYIQTYCGILKDHELDVVNSRGDPSKIQELIPFVESILWGCQKVNMTNINRFNKFLFDVFGPSTLNELSKGTHLLPEIKECFVKLNPTDVETKRFFCEFCLKHKIDISTLNELGHQIVVNERGEFVEPPEPIVIEVDKNAKVTIINPGQPGYPGPLPEPTQPNHTFPQPGPDYPGSFPGGPYPGSFPGGPYPGSFPGGPYQGGYPGPYPGAFPGGPYQGGPYQGTPYPGPNLGGWGNPMGAYPGPQGGFYPPPYQQCPQLQGSVQLPGPSSSYQAPQNQVITPPPQLSSSGQQPQQQQFAGSPANPVDEKPSNNIQSPYPDFEGMKFVMPKDIGGGGFGSSNDPDMEEFNARMEKLKKGL